METTRQCCTTGACPFALTDVSEQAQNYGCLPTHIDIVSMKVHFNKTWACHSNPTKPCLGSLRFLKAHGFEYKVSGTLVTEDSDWHNYIKRDRASQDALIKKIQQHNFKKYTGSSHEFSF